MTDVPLTLHLFSGWWAGHCSPLRSIYVLTQQLNNLPLSVQKAVSSQVENFLCGGAGVSPYDALCIFLTTLDADFKKKELIHRAKEDGDNGMQLFS